MSSLNWGMIQDGGNFESLIHAILFAEDAGTLLFGRPGKDASQDARSADGSVIYQAKYRQGLVMDGAVDLALEELEKIKKYRQLQHPNYKHWQHARRWILLANLSINPNDDAKWQSCVVPRFQQEGLTAEYWHIETLEGKLASHAHVRDVFFGGENQVLVGLKEAHELLSASCVGSTSLEALMVGRDNELSKIIDFADSSDKRILPVVGPGGIGKSRLLYESLVSLSQNGWRVLWALPGTMARSARWFHLLSGNQRTCVAIDDPDDPGLLRAVIEQLATVEHRNWKVIISCRTEKAEALWRFRFNKWGEQTMVLESLGELDSKQLLSAYLAGQGKESWLHSVFQYTHGVPGWLCLIGELAKRGTLSELPSNVDEVSATYIDSCLQSLGESRRQQGHTLLRWLALWGALKLDTANGEQAELNFLETQGIPNEAAHILLRDLVGTGLVRNWGIGKRLYAVEPLIIREQILSSWLLTGYGEAYRVNADGTRLVTQLVKGGIPAVDMALHTLSHLTRSRLAEPEGESFLKPVFDAMLSIARDGNLLDQYHVLDFVEKAGAIDPDNALDVLATIRKCPKENMDVDVSPWGAQTFSRVYLMAKLPWVAFQIAEHVSDFVVARRYLEEFREYVTMEDAGEFTSGSGKGARQLVKRLLCESKSAEFFAKPSQDILTAGLNTISAWPFVGILLESLLKAERSSMEWVGNWKIALVRRLLIPGSSEWNMTANLREMVFDALKSAGAAEIRGWLWHIIAESHHDFHRAVLHGNVTGATIAPYRAVLRADLTSCAAILQSPPEQLTIELATHAREMWSWYLTYGRPDDPIDLARQCEQIYNHLSRWRLHEFFQFRADEELAPVTERIVNILRAATEPKAYSEFFEEARRYLESAQRGSRDMANSWRILKLADECADLLSLDPELPLNALSSYVVMVLNQMNDERALDWIFTVRVCQKYLLGIKIGGDEVAVRGGLERLLGFTQAKSRLLYGLYSNVHPASTGALIKVELDCVLEHERDFSFRERFILLGAFALVSWDTVQLHLQGCLEGLRDEPVEATNCMFCFIQSFHLALIRYEGAPSQRPTAWIIEMITHFELDGSLFGYELSDLRDQTGFTLSMSQMVDLIRSRMELEQRPKASDRFEILPYEFEVNSWCKLDEANGEEVVAFHELCQLALDNSFTALYRMPKYIAQLNPTGCHVASFVNQYIRDNSDIDAKGLARLGYLASAYPDDSEAWATVARPICSLAQTLRKDDRGHVYFGLSRKETGVIVSVPGEVAEYYIQARDNAARMLAAEPVESPLRSYREWAYLRAEANLSQENGRAEEVANA